MLSLEEAQKRILAAIKPLGSETVSLREAAGRVLAQDVTATMDLPAFDNSAMDGYAVRADDVRAASADNPVRLRLIGKIAAGSPANLEITPGTACRIFTGSPMPLGADAVVMQEDTSGAGEDVDVFDPVKPWEHVRLRGEDVKRGDVLCRGGDRITAGTLGVLGANGIDQMQVTLRPRVALLATGDELQEPGEPLSEDGKIFESNRLMLATLVASAGAQATVLPIVRDSREATRAALEFAFSNFDAVITTGGVSVGEHDFVKESFAAIGGTMDFWRVSIRPGKPFVFGRRGENFLFGLPGNPVSAFVTFLLLVRPALLTRQGARAVHLSQTRGVLGEPFVNLGDRRHFVRVIVDGEGVVRSAGAQASHMLGSLARANGLLDLPPKSEFAQGEIAPVLQWETA